MLTLIVEPHSRGHHLDYVGLLVEDCQSTGTNVAVLTTSEAFASAEWRVHLHAYTPQVAFLPLSQFNLSTIAEVATQLGAQITVLPDADRYVTAVLRQGWAGSGVLRLLVMRADVQPGPPLAWTRPAKTALKRTLIFAAGLRSRIRIVLLRSPLTPRRGPLRWVSDPVRLKSTLQETRAIRAQLDCDEGRYWLGVFGDITARKNLPLIIEAISGIPSIGLLIAGPIDPSVSAAVAPLIETFVASGGRVEHFPGPLTDSEFDAAIGAVDCVVAAHSNEGPSGIVLKAAASGRRLVLAGADSLRRDAAQLKDQADWTPLEAESLRRAIEHARHLPDPPRTIVLNADEFISKLLCDRTDW